MIPIALSRTVGNFLNNISPQIAFQDAATRLASYQGPIPDSLQAPLILAQKSNQTIRQPIPIGEQVFLPNGHIRILTRPEQASYVRDPQTGDIVGEDYTIAARGRGLILPGQDATPKRGDSPNAPWHFRRYTEFQHETWLPIGGDTPDVTAHRSRLIRSRVTPDGNFMYRTSIKSASGHEVLQLTVPMTPAESAPQELLIAKRSPGGKMTGHRFTWQDATLENYQTTQLNKLPSWFPQDSKPKG